MHAALPNTVNTCMGRLPEICMVDTVIAIIARQEKSFQDWLVDDAPSKFLVPAVVLFAAAAAARLLRLPCLVAAPSHPLCHGRQLDVEQRLVVHESRLAQLAALQRGAAEGRLVWTAMAARGRPAGTPDVAGQHTYTCYAAHVCICTTTATAAMAGSRREYC